MDHDRMPERDDQIYLNGCDCRHLWEETDCMERDFDSWPVGMAYVPMQPWEKPFELSKGLRAGTIFPSLRLPFRGGGR